MIRWSPSNDLAGLHSAMDRLFGDVFGDTYTHAGQQQEGSPQEPGQRPTYHLPVNISQTENGYRIEAPVPGFRPQDVEITFADGVLTIGATRREERERKEGGYLRREVAFGNYRRQITLPGDVRADDIKANFENGVLTVDVPRAPRPEPKRIEIRPAQARQEESSRGSKQTANAGARNG